MLYEAARNLGELQARERARMSPRVNAALDEGRAIGAAAYQAALAARATGDRVLHAMARRLRRGPDAVGARRRAARPRDDRRPVVLHAVVAAGLPGASPADRTCVERMPLGLQLAAPQGSDDAAAGRRGVVRGAPAVPGLV